MTATLYIRPDILAGCKTAKETAITDRKEIHRGGIRRAGKSAKRLMLWCLELHNRAQSRSPSCGSVTSKERANSQVWLADHRSNSEL